MPPTSRFDERIGKVFLPEADAIDTGRDFTPNPEGPELPPGIPGLPPELEEPRLPIKWPPDLIIPKFCITRLKPGCYTLGFTPTGTPIFGTRYRGTLRVESIGTGLGIRMSGDLYSHRLFDDIVVKWPLEKARVFGPIRDAGIASDGPGGEAADTGGVIPIYPRRKYRSYLKGTSAQLFKIVPRGTPCSFTLNFDEFVYNHPAAGFSGSFNTAPTRSVRFVLRHTSTADMYSGEAYSGTTLLGTVSIRWVSDFFRRAHLQLNTLTGAEAPPASVGTSTFSTIFADTGWDLSFTDGGGIPLPGTLSGVNINACWSNANLHTLVSSVPGYNPADLDSVWRVHLVAVPAAMNCSRGVMFDSTTFGADPNSVPREGSGTFSRDGYPATEVPDGMGGSHYDGAANQQQRNVPRAFLRSATHEVGHAFNQIHQGFELGNDNSIMSPTPSVATVLGVGGTFPDAINLAFNDTVKKHLRHLPDPAVRPGAMDFFGSAVSAPEASDVAWPETLEVTVVPSSDQIALGEPIDLAFTLKNTGPAPVPVPETLDVPSLTVRISVTDPSGRITFMRPYNVSSCPSLNLIELAPGKSVEGQAPLFWGTEGFAFTTPGRHEVDVIILWNVAGVHVAATGSHAVYVSYPTSKTDNDMAALLLDPEVGRAIATKRAWQFERAAERIKQATSKGGSHPAAKAIARLAVLTPPRRTGPTTRGGSKGAGATKRGSPRRSRKR
jgi:hypothetical protein